MNDNRKITLIGSKRCEAPVVKESCTKNGMRNIALFMIWLSIEGDDTQMAVA
jgi:hypothetical protein